jgi:hypothetical protein
MRLSLRLRFGIGLLALLIAGNVLLVINEGISWRTAFFALPTVLCAIGLWLNIKRASTRI